MGEERIKVLIVDDEYQNRKLLKLFCERWHFAVVEASDGKEALEKAMYEKPDIVLMDAIMPEVDGFTATRLLKSNPSTKHIPVVIITALDDIEQKDRSVRVGADGFIVKPIDMESLRAKLHDVVYNSRHINRD